MKEFWLLFRESIILQGLLTVGIWTGIMVIILRGGTPPDALVNVGYTIIGFWFGTKVQTAISQLSGGQHGE